MGHPFTSTIYRLCSIVMIISHHTIPRIFILTLTFLAMHTTSLCRFLVLLIRYLYCISPSPGCLLSLCAFSSVYFDAPHPLLLRCPHATFPLDSYTARPPIAHLPPQLVSFLQLFVEFVVVCPAGLIVEHLTLHNSASQVEKHTLLPIYCVTA